MNSENNVSVDEMPRHILDVRGVVSEDEEEDFEDCSESLDNIESLSGAEESNPLRRSTRVRRPPSYLADYDLSA